METFYICVPQGFWEECGFYGQHLESNIFIASKFDLVAAKFICNRYAELAPGDIYKVSLRNSDDKIFFLLKSGFTIVDTKTMEEYRLKDTLRNLSERSSFRSTR